MSRYWTADSDLDWRNSVDPEEPPMDDPDPEDAVAEQAATPSLAPQVPAESAPPRLLPAGAPLGRIARALARAQLKIANPGKAAVNPHFRSKYADLASGIDAIRAPLAEQEIAVVQTMRMAGEILILETRLIHSSGESLGTEWPVGAYARLSPQQMGSALTYARRYSLFPLVGIAGADEDDDGNAASTEPPFVMGTEEIVYIESMLRDLGESQERFLGWIKAPSIAELTADQYKRALDNLNRKKREAAHGPAHA